MVGLALGLLHLEATGIDVEADGRVVDGAHPRFEIELEVGQCEVIAPELAAGRLATSERSSALILQARVAVRLLETLAGVEVRVTSLVAERPGLEPGVTLVGPEPEITLIPGADLDDSLWPPVDERIVVTDGGRGYTTDETGSLVNRPRDEGASTSGVITLPGPSRRVYSSVWFRPSATKRGAS